MCVFFLNELFTFVIMCVCVVFFIVLYCFIYAILLWVMFWNFFWGGGILINKRKTIFWLIKVHKIIKCTKVKSCSGGWQDYLYTWGLIKKQPQATGEGRHAGVNNRWQWDIWDEEDGKHRGRQLQQIRINETREVKLNMKHARYDKK